MLLRPCPSRVGSTWSGMCMCVQTAIGHWGETMFPLFSILKREASFAWPPAQFILLHLKRVTPQFFPLLHVDEAIHITCNLQQICAVVRPPCGID